MPRFAKMSAISFPQRPQWEGTHWKTTFVLILRSSSLKLWTLELCLSYLPRPEVQSLSLIKLQPYQEGKDGQKADEGPNDHIASLNSWGIYEISC